jgi:hypothetical protein
MIDTKDGNIFGAKPVLGGPTDRHPDDTTMGWIKRLLNKTGLAAFDTGFNDDMEVYGDKTAKSIYEIERHLHNREKWFGAAAVAVGETHVADRITLLPDPFRVDAGNDKWGDWLQILGSSDTPVEAVNNKFDFHKFLVVDHENNAQDHFLQVATGEYADLPDKVAAEEMTEFGFLTGGGLATAAPIEFLDRRSNKGTKAWVRCWADTQNTSWLDFYHGIHEYIY